MYFTRLGLTSKVESQTSKNSFRGEYPDAFYFALYCIGSDYEGQYCCSHHCKALFWKLCVMTIIISKGDIFDLSNSH